MDRETGYRSYRLGQANRAEAIRVLRRCDMPLDAIADILDRADDPSHVEEVLRTHRHRHANELHRHQEMLDHLDVLLNGHRAVLRYEISLESVPDRTTASLRVHTDLDTMPAQLADGFTRVAERLASTGTRPSGPPLVVLHDIIDVDDPGEIEIAIPIHGAPSGMEDVHVMRLPGGRAAVTTHRGPYLQLAPAYHAMTDWMVANGHQPGGSPREIYLNDPRHVDEEELLTRVEWPLR